MYNKEYVSNTLKNLFLGSTVKWVIDYDDDIFIALVLDNKVPEEDQMDPFYSFNKKTGELLDYSIMNADQDRLRALLKDV